MHIFSQAKAWVIWFFADLKSTIQSRGKGPVRIKFSWFIAIPLLFAALLCIVILFIHPLIGLADNGDYMRVTHPSGIYQPPIITDDAVFDYFRHDYPLYQHFNEIKTDYVTSQLLLIRLAVTINKLIVSKTTFDIRVIAAIYLLGFLFSMLLVLLYLRGELKTTKLYILSSALVIFVFADIGYIAYFNSFYGEPLTYVSFLALVSSLLLLHRKAAPDWALLMVILASSVIFVTAKQQNSPSAFLIAPLLVRTAFIRKGYAWKTCSFLSAGIVLAFGMFIYTAISDSFVNINKYHAMTRGVLLQAKNPEKALSEFDIDPQYSILADTIYFDHTPIIDPDNPILTENFYARYSSAKILRYYVLHPERMLAMMNIAAEHSFNIRPFMGNFEKAAGREPGARSYFFALYSTVKERLFPHTLGTIFLLFAVFVFLYAKEYIAALKRRDSRTALRLETFMFVGLMQISQMAISVIGAGDADLAKHNFVCNVCNDVLLLFAVTGALGYSGEKRESGAV